MRDIVYVNGRFVPKDEAMVSVEDRGYQFSDGVYEVVRFHGRQGVRLDAHLHRMQRSCGHLRIEGGLSVAEWHEALNQLMEESQIPDEDDFVTALYQQVSRGVSPRNHLFPLVSVSASNVAYFRQAPKYTPQQRTQGIALSSQPDERWERCYIKSVSLLPVVLAKQAAAEAGAFEALLVRNKIVTEGGAANAYCVRGGEVWTHPEGPHILSGITRGLVLEAAARAHVKVREERVSLEDFRASDEAFISSSTMDIMPATRLDNQPIGNGTVGPVTQKLVAAITEIIQLDLRTSALA